MSRFGTGPRIRRRLGRLSEIRLHQVDSEGPYLSEQCGPCNPKCVCCGAPVPYQICGTSHRVHAHLVGTTWLPRSIPSPTSGMLTSAQSRWHPTRCPTRELFYRPDSSGSHLPVRLDGSFSPSSYSAFPGSAVINRLNSSPRAQHCRRLLRACNSYYFEAAHLTTLAPNVRICSILAAVVSAPITNTSSVTPAST